MGHITQGRSSRRHSWQTAANVAAVFVFLAIVAAALAIVAWVTLAPIISDVASL